MTRIGIKKTGKMRSAGRPVTALFSVVLAMLISHGIAVAGSSEVIDKGMKIKFSAEAAGGQKEVMADEHASVIFSITDVSTDEPVTALKPAVWLDLLWGDEGETPVLDQEQACREKVKIYLKGTLAVRPLVDLNSYYVLSMNEDATISVIDPIVGMKGITNLYAIIKLDKPAEDWVLGKDERRLFVTMPGAAKVAVVDAGTFSVVRNIDAGINPVRIALQPDARYLWVGNDSQDDTQSGVTVIDSVSLDKVAIIPTGRGHHEIAFSGDSLTAFITNSDEGYVSVVDIQKLRKISDIRTGEGAVSMSVSDLGNSVYVAHEQSGTLAVIDGESRELITRISLKPGLSAVRFAPGGRWGFVSNPKDDTVEVIDASMNRVVQSLKVGMGPERVFFSGRFAYIQLARAAEVAVIPLSSAGIAGAELHALKIVAGEKPPEESRYRSRADTIVPAGEYDTVLITNPSDGLIYYYMEGMEVSMGSFRSAGRVARASMVIGRNMRETSKGVYSAKFRVPKAGSYEAALLLDSPRVVSCFRFTVLNNPSASQVVDAKTVAVEVLNTDNTVRAGEDATLRFRLRDPSGKGPLSGITDMAIFVTRTPGTWKQRVPVRDQGSGLYEVSFKAPEPGVYYVFFSSRSLRIDHTQAPYFVFYARDAGWKQQRGG
ncbi:MAG: hypothetical protein HZB33_02820 [Nitrospirae bacterium]|nr:hypothetical protein [Nitrospirota bacterium]